MRLKHRTQAGPDTEILEAQASITAEDLGDINIG